MSCSKSDANQSLCELPALKGGMRGGVSGTGSRCNGLLLIYQGLSRKTRLAWLLQLVWYVSVLR
jgi:hypothetical protein